MVMPFYFLLCCMLLSVMTNLKIFCYELVRTAEQKARDWEMVVKMTLIARDLMVGNPKLGEMGYEEGRLVIMRSQHRLIMILPRKQPSIRLFPGEYFDWRRRRARQASSLVPVAQSQGWFLL